MQSRNPEGDSVGLLLAHIGRLQHRQAHARLEALGLYRGQFWVLRALWDHPGVSQRELADLLCVEPATVTNALQRMEKADLVERRSDPADQRIQRVHPTAAALALRDRLQADWDEFEALITAGFVPQELDQVRAYLRRVAANLEAQEADRDGLSPYPTPPFCSVASDVEA